MNYKEGEIIFKKKHLLNGKKLGMIDQENFCRSIK